MLVFIEFWKAKDSWRSLSQDERGAFLGQIGPTIEDLVSKGVVMDAWGVNTDTTPFKAAYDYYAITKFPTQELLEGFTAIVEGSGWYNYFDQINIAGENIGAEATIGHMITK